MSTYGGAYSETDLLEIRVRADKIGFNDRISQQFNPDISVVNAVKAVETAKVLQGRAVNKDVGVEIMWDNYCDYEAVANVDCIIGGHESSTNTETKDVTFVKVVKFSFNEHTFISNEYDIDEHIAKGFIKADVELCNAFAQYAVGQIDSFTGVNVFTGGKGNVVSTDTYIDSANWNSALVAYFSRVANHNKFTTPTFLSGDNLYEQIFVANANSGNANGKGDAVLYSNMNMFFDPFNVDSVNTPDLKTYMLSMGSLAMGMKYYNPVVPQRMQTFTRWAIESRFIPGLWFDVWYNDECVEDDFIKHNFKMKIRADVWNNPAGCNQQNTGVLSFTCGTAP